MTNYLTWNTLAEGLCLLVALFTLNRAKERIWRVFPLYLLIVVCTELTSIYLRRHGMGQTNWLYNIYGIVEISAINLMLHEILKHRISTWGPFYLGICIVACVYLAELIFGEFSKRYNIPHGVFSLFVVLCALTYLKRLMEDPHYITLSRDPNFWWIMGAIFFYFAFTSLNVLHVKLDTETKVVYHPLFKLTFRAVNVILYSIWSYAFICKRWKQRA